MTSNFHLVGLSKPKSATLHLLGTDRTTFWASIDMTKDRFDALFNWAKTDDNFWKEDKIAVVEHDGFYEDGTPKKPVMKEILV
jgi:hypothetical protein